MGMEEGRDWFINNTRLSGPSWFDKIEAAPAAPHLQEDIENLFTDAVGLNLMRSALWGQEDESGTQRRIVTYSVKSTNKHAEVRRVNFTGQLLFTGNKPLEAIPELEAVSTRIEVENPVLTREELLAIMKFLCLKGKQTDKGYASPEDCMDVYRQYVAEITEDTKLDLRVLYRLIKLKIGTRQLKIKTPFNELVRRAVQQSTESQQPLTRSQRVSREKDIAIELKKMGLTGNQLQKEWMKRTGYSTTNSFYRRVKY
jgi:hypothetical protein